MINNIAFDEIDFMGRTVKIEGLISISKMTMY